VSPLSVDDVAGRPLPAPDAVSAPYWEAAAEGRLLFQQCTVCGNRQFYPRAMCTACAGAVEWLESSGRGTVHTFTVIRQNWSEPFKSQLPYVVAMVDLDEGVRMMAGLTDCEPDDVRIGMAVEAYTVEVEDGLGIPFFRPVEAAS
jgi:uncharacterized OB-fold protein